MLKEACARVIHMAGLAGMLTITSCAPRAEAEFTKNVEHAAQANDGIGDATLVSAIANAPTIRVYKSPNCECCALWVDHMREAGFELDVENTHQMVGVKIQADVPLQLQTCHTALVGDHVFEGHVPADVIARFLAEAPPARGLAVPGHPLGSPGMELGDRVEAYEVIQFDVQGGTSVYERR